MSKFKDLVQQDLATFVNQDEFAETHTINGVSCEVVVDNDQLKERSKKEYDGLSVGELLIYVRPSVFQKKPQPGTPINFDGKMMQVFDCREDMGLYELILTQNRGV